MDVISYLMYSKLLSCSGNGANVKVDEDGNIITSNEDLKNVNLYVDFSTANLMTEGDIFSVSNDYLIAKIISSVAESNKKAWILSMVM